MWQSTSSTALNTAQLTDHFTLIQMVSERSGGGKWSGEKVMGLLSLVNNAKIVSCGSKPL